MRRAIASFLISHIFHTSWKRHFCAREAPSLARSILCPSLIRGGSISRFSSWGKACFKKENRGIVQSGPANRRKAPCRSCDFSEESRFGRARFLGKTRHHPKTAPRTSPWRCSGEHMASDKWLAACSGGGRRRGRPLMGALAGSRFSHERYGAYGIPDKTGAASVFGNAPLRLSMERVSIYT